MPSTPRVIEQRVEQIERALEISGLTNSAQTLVRLPVDSILISKGQDCPVTYGTWKLLDKGNLLGEEVGNIHVWKRTA